MITVYKVNQYFAAPLFEGYKNYEKVRYTTTIYVKKHLFFNKALYLPFIIDCGYPLKLFIEQRG